MNVAAVTASVFCICLANWTSYEGSVQAAISMIICISFIILLIIMLMLNRLPQAIENLPFKVRYFCINFKLLNRKCILFMLYN